MAFRVNSESSTTVKELELLVPGFALPNNTSGYVSEYVSCFGWSAIQISIRTQVEADLTIDFTDFTTDSEQFGQLPSTVGAGMPTFTKRISTNGLKFLSIPVSGCLVRVRMLATGNGDNDATKFFKMSAVLSNNPHYIMT
jgi:hypothetical protein